MCKIWMNIIKVRLNKRSSINKIIYTEQFYSYKFQKQNYCMVGEVRILFSCGGWEVGMTSKRHEANLWNAGNALFLYLCVLLTFESSHDKSPLGCRHRICSRKVPVLF